mmetsp:Transcript_63219/g.165767  ORF Transcript_63219/g.165767 Transcript_63219/m.165767 type:complete len:488 (+) Transcript_63219:1-1464(+)
MLLLRAAWCLTLAAVAFCHSPEDSHSAGCRSGKLPLGAKLGHTMTFDGIFGGAKRRWHVHVPLSYKTDVAVPLVMATHGWHDTAKAYEPDSGLSVLSEIHGYIVVYPEAMADHAGAHRESWGGWNVVGSSIGVGPLGPTCYPWADPAVSLCYRSCSPCTQKPHCQWSSCVNDVTPSGVGTDNVTGFLPMLFDDLEEKYCIDRQRLYATGLSNGGMAAYQLGVSMAHRLAAIAPVAGSFMKGFVQAPSIPLPVMDVHGFFDTSVPPNGTSTSSDGYFYTELSEIFDGWRKSNKCHDHGKDAVLKHWPTPVDGQKDLYCISEGTGCSAPVVRCGWSGPHGSFAKGLGNGIPNARLVWSFLSQFKSEPVRKAEHTTRSSKTNHESLTVYSKLGSPLPLATGQEAQPEALSATVLATAASEQPLLPAAFASRAATGEGTALSIIDMNAIGSVAFLTFAAILCMVAHGERTKSSGAGRLSEPMLKLVAEAAL